MKITLDSTQSGNLIGLALNSSLFDSEGYSKNNRNGVYSSYDPCIKQFIKDKYHVVFQAKDGDNDVYGTISGTKNNVTMMLLRI